jgi:hypothetical protein
VLYLDFGTKLGLVLSFSSSVLQSTDYEMTVHLRSMSESFPLNMGADAESAASSGVNGRSIS